TSAMILGEAEHRVHGTTGNERRPGIKSRQGRCMLPIIVYSEQLQIHSRAAMDQLGIKCGIDQVVAKALRGCTSCWIREKEAFSGSAMRSPEIRAQSFATSTPSLSEDNASLGGSQGTLKRT